MHHKHNTWHNTHMFQTSHRKWVQKYNIKQYSRSNACYFPSTENISHIILLHTWLLTHCFSHITITCRVCNSKTAAKILAICRKSSNLVLIKARALSHLIAHRTYCKTLNSKKCLSFMYRNKNQCVWVRLEFTAPVPRCSYQHVSGKSGFLRDVVGVSHLLLHYESD